MSSENPYPTRLDTPDRELIDQLNELTGIPKGTLISRLVKFALSPMQREKFLQAMFPTADDLLDALNRNRPKVAEVPPNYLVKPRNKRGPKPGSKRAKKKAVKKKSTGTEKTAKRAKKKAVKKKTARKKP